MDVTLAVKKDRRLSIGSHDQSNTPLARTPNALVVRAGGTLSS
jgi:hypothetical protein